MIGTDPGKPLDPVNVGAWIENLEYFGSLG